MKKLLYVWTGEFGWEIVTVIPELNAYQNDYDVTILSYGSVEKMYSDMNVKFVSHGLEYRNSGENRGAIKKVLDELNIDRFDFDILRVPSHPRTDKISFKKKPKVIREDIDLARKKKKILIHARKFKKSRTGRNWRESYNELLDHLKKRGFRLFFIGHPDFSVCVDEFGKDARTTDIETTIRHIKESVLALGPSSGPLVLSQWCMTPVFTWGCADMRMFDSQVGIDLPKKFTIQSNKKWNPFSTPHYHPWSACPNKQAIMTYCNVSYVPRPDELIRGIDFALKSEYLIDT